MSIRAGQYEAEESTNRSATGSRIQVDASIPMPWASARQGGTRESSEISFPLLFAVAAHYSMSLAHELGEGVEVGRASARA